MGRPRSAVRKAKNAAYVAGWKEGANVALREIMPLLDRFYLAEMARTCWNGLIVPQGVPRRRRTS